MSNGDPTPPYEFKKHEPKHILSDVKRLQKVARSFVDSENSYRQLGFEEAARRANKVHWTMADAIKVMQTGTSSRI